MQATLVISKNPLVPSQNREVTTLRRRRRLDKLAPKTDQPFICIHNGKPLLRKHWKTTCIKDNDVVVFAVLPQGGGGGGGGSDPMRTILTIALIVTIAIVAPPLAGMLGASGALGIALVKGGLMIAGQALINAIIPPPKNPSTRVAADIASASPTYNVQAQGNAARVGQAIPVQYGRHIAFPDFAASPYGEFVSNDQYLYQLFCLGQGSYDIEAIRIEDTPVENYEEIDYEIVPPGGTVTLFPTEVITSVEVAGAEALTGVPLGPFVANPADTQVNYIAVDTVCPRGLYYANDNGSLSPMTTEYEVEAREIDNAGAPVGAWFTLGENDFQASTVTSIDPNPTTGVVTVSAASTTPQRRSNRWSVPLGRYEVRFTRLDTKDVSTRAGHELVWAGLRTYLPSTQQYGNVTMIAMRFKATNNLSQAASRRVNVISTRKLPTWTGSMWTDPVPTQSIAWAIADAARNTDYGAKRADSALDIAALLELDAVWNARGDTFNARYDSSVTFWEAVQQIARAGRAKPFMQSGVLRFVRDQEQSLPVAMFSPHNIVKSSLRIDYLMPTPETADHVVVEYFDESTWATTQVSAALEDSVSETPARVQLFGVTNRSQAWREGMYIAASNRYRRKAITLTTEMEGMIPTFGDLVAVASERLTAAQSGELVAWDADLLTATLSEPVVFGSNTMYIALRRRNGSMDGPYVVTPGPSTDTVVFNSAPSTVPYVGQQAERTHFSFGSITEYRQLAVMISSKPSRNVVEIGMVGEYIDGDGKLFVHYADTGVPPAPLEPWQLPRLFKVPNTPTNLTVTEQLVFAQGIVRSRMDISWDLDKAAEGYRVAYRTGTGSWVQVPDTADTTVSVYDPPEALLEIRVLAYAATRESLPAYTTKTILGKSAPPQDVIGFFIDGDTLSWTGVPDLDLAGYQVRFNYGQNVFWGDAVPMHTDLLVASPFVLTARPAGPITLLIKAFDTSGNESVNAATIVTELNATIADNVWEEWPQAPTFIGTKTNCTVVGGVLEAIDLDLFYGTDTAAFYGADTAPFYPATTYAAMQYEFEAVTTHPGSLILLQDIQGSFTIEYQRDDPSPMYGPDMDFYYGPDADPFFGPTTGWLPWPGAVTMGAGERFAFRVSVVGGAVQGTIDLLTAQLSVPTLVEDFNDIIVSAAGTRLPLGLDFTVLLNIQLTVQSDGNGGISARVVDKDADLGPMIEVLNAAGTPVIGLADARVQGY